MLSTHSLSFSNCLILFLLVNSSSGFNPSAKISCLSCSSSSSFSCLNLASRACKALRFSYKSYIIPIYNLLAHTIWFINRVECFWLITNKDSHLFITHRQTCKKTHFEISYHHYEKFTQISKELLLQRDTNYSSYLVSFNIAFKTQYGLHSVFHVSSRKFLFFCFLLTNSAMYTRELRSICKPASQISLTL